MRRLFSFELADFAHDLRWSPDGATLAAATLSGEIVCLDGESGDVRFRSPGHAGGALSLAFSPDGERLVTGGQDGSVRLLDAANGAEIRALPIADSPWVTAIAWPKAHPEAFGVAAGRALRFFSKDGEVVSTIGNLPSTVACVFFHAKLDLFGAGHYGGITLASPGQAKMERRLAYRGSVLEAEASPDGRFVASGNQDATARFWDLEQKDEATLTGYPEKLKVLAWAPNSVALATGGGTKIVVWMCAKGPPVGTSPATLSHHEKRVTGLSFSHEGDALFSCGEDGRFCRWSSKPGDIARVDEELRVDFPLYKMAHDTRHGRVACAGFGGRVVAFAV